MTGRFQDFESMEAGAPERVQVSVRHGARSSQLDALVAALDAIPWSRLEHAYGDASDVPALLYAVTVGDARTCKAAWWELWGNIHHQGTLYTASVEAVPFIAAVGEADEHPDRIQALSFLRAIALGDGEHAYEVRRRVQPYVARFIERLPQEPEQVRRAIVWLASAFPSLVREHPGLANVVPRSMRATWAEVLDRVSQGNGDEDADEGDDAALDREDELEGWLLAGWTEAADDDDG